MALSIDYAAGANVDRPEHEPIMVIHGPALEAYRFGDTHPLSPYRHALTIALLRSLGWLDENSVVVREPRPASLDELLTVHTYQYVQAVQRGQAVARGTEPIADLRVFGLGTSDNPLFVDMHDAAVLSTGASIQAMQAVMAGEALHAYNPAGGLHHALRSTAAGFCIYNDPAACITAAVKAGLRVAYVDLDAHHGDGVQECFWDQPSVLTISIHESGRFAFPGTGDISEMGGRKAKGSSINVPFPPLAGDEAYLMALDEVVEPALDLFRPDILVTQTGCDTHRSDPLADLTATLALYPSMAERLHGMVHRYTGGRWVILGGGGYDPFNVTPRAWAAFFGSVLGFPTKNVRLPTDWLAAARSLGGDPPALLLDDGDPPFEPLRPNVARVVQEVRESGLARLKQLVRR